MGAIQEADPYLTDPYSGILVAQYAKGSAKIREEM